MILADIITIGDEILIGQIVDTNSAYIASKLNAVGFQVRKIISVSDTEQAIISSLDESIQNTDLVILTGGLGPTNDDITKKTLKAYFGGDYKEDTAAAEYVKALCEQRGLTLSERNKFQAMVPESCSTLRNRSGSAPGMVFRKNKSMIVSLPGVTFEMKDILDNELLPLVKHEFKLPFRLQKTILTCGISESAAADSLSEFEKNLADNASLAYLPSPGVLRLRISISGDKEDQLKNQLSSLTNEIETTLGIGTVFGHDEDTLQAVVGNLLVNNDLSLAIAESCTGGNIARMITSVPGSSVYLKGSVTAYSNEIKQKILGVSSDSLEKEGAVSRSVVEQMAVGIRVAMESDLSIATSGIAGPGGGTEEKPVGTTWIAVATPEKIYSHKFLFGDNRDRNILRASVTALNWLRRIILKYHENSG